MSKEENNQISHFEYNPEKYHNELRELCSKAKDVNHKTIKLPTKLVGLISSWLLHLHNLENMHASCLNTVKEFEDLLQRAQNIYNSEERSDKKLNKIKNLLGIYKQKSIDKKGEPYDDAQLFKDYCRTVKAWSEKELSSKELIDKKELIIKKMLDRHNIASRGAFIGRLKRGKKHLTDKGEDSSQFEGVLPKDWHTD